MATVKILISAHFQHLLLLDQTRFCVSENDFIFFELHGNHLRCPLGGRGGLCPDCKTFFRELGWEVSTCNMRRSFNKNL